MVSYFFLIGVGRPKGRTNGRCKSRILRYEALEYRLALSSNPIMPVPVLNGSNFVDPLGPPQGVGYGTPVISPNPYANQPASPVSPLPAGAFFPVPFPFDRFQEAPTPRGLSGIFTETGLPHAYEDEQLLARETDIGDDANVEPDVDSNPRSEPTRDQQPDHGDQGIWMGNEDDSLIEAGVERKSLANHEEGSTSLTKNAIVSRTPTLDATRLVAVDAVFTDAGGRNQGITSLLI